MDNKKLMLRATYSTRGTLPLCYDKLDTKVRELLEKGTDYKYLGLCSNGKNFYETTYIFFRPVESFEGEDVDEIIETEDIIFGI